MSLVQLGELIDDHRIDLEKAGVRGIDLDYLLDLRVDHKSCEAALQRVIDGELARFNEVVSQLTTEQWAYFEATDTKNNETKALKKASKELVTAFKKNVLCFFKAAEERSIEERRKPKVDPAGIELKR